MQTCGLLTDFYELTMAQGYFQAEMNERAVFEMYFRRHPFKGEFTIFAGLSDFLSLIKNFRFSDDDLEYLKSLKLFKNSFLDYLADFRFTGDIYACAEGSAVFPNQPLVRVHGTLIETQLIESLLLNIINFQTMIATKTARIYLAAGKSSLLEFGLRRAQGIDGALSATRAAYIGGASGTSHTLAGKLLSIPVKGTMAHSWVMAFSTEEEAFREYAMLYPDNCILLLDTYSTLDSGIINAINIFKELKSRGHKNYGVRLDSGETLSLSHEVRHRLDAAGFPEAVIALSGDLDEQKISLLMSKGAPVDLWGVGTRMVTGGAEGALSGVYKLTAICRDERWWFVGKTSDDKYKSSLPGIKQVYRYRTKDKFSFDIIALAEEDPEELLIRPLYSRESAGNNFVVTNTPPNGTSSGNPLLQPVMRSGSPTEQPTLEEIRANTMHEMELIPPACLELNRPQQYRTYFTEKVYTAMKGCYSTAGE